MEGADDFKSMNEVVNAGCCAPWSRMKLQKAFGNLPDLMVIVAARGQLSLRARPWMRQTHIPTRGCKQLEEVYVPGGMKQ